MPRSYAFLALFLAALLVASGCAPSKEVVEVTDRPEPVPSTETPPQEPDVAETPMPADTVRAGRFDKGKMWTFDNPPIDYFQEAYGFTPDSAWFEKARLGALRFSTYCSASLVSPTGLVMTNHHCARESVAAVSGEEEGLLDSGFYAETLEAERKVPKLYVEQLLAIDDVTSRVHAVGQSIRDTDRKAQVRTERAEQIEEEMTGAAKRRDTTLYVQVIELYDGGQYSAYTFRKYNDVRLVMAPEHQLGYFGGDPDNFTYPRYSLDMSFFRVYDGNGEPLKTGDYFRWSTTGAQPGDPVFVVGNPGTTSRLNTVRELEYERDVVLPRQIDALERRANAIKTYLDAAGDSASKEVRNTYFSITNSIKSSKGQLGGLQDPYLIARRRASETQLQQDIAATDSLQELYGDVLVQIGQLQQSKETLASRLSAFSFFGTELGSRVLTRGLYGYYYSLLKSRGFLPPDELAEIKEEALGFEDWPNEVERRFIALRLKEVQEALPSSDPTVRSLLGNTTPDSVAARLVEESALVDSAGFAALLDSGYLSSDDPSVPIIEALAPLYFQFIQQQQSFGNREEILKGQLALARFALYGTDIPPDASFSPRIADGVVRGYAYNGTKAPAYTTYFGLYDHHYSYAGRGDWALPERWLTPPETFDRSTPLNLATTNDITGGNSGSPLLNKDLEIVGLVFDGNIESLPNTYLFRDVLARTVSVDARGILEALDDIYDADRIVLELTTGQMAASEEEADAMGSQ